MAHPNDIRPDPLKPTAVTNKPAEQHLPGTPNADKGIVTGTQPGMPERAPKADPNAGHGSERKDRPGIDPAGTNTDRTRPGSDEAVDNESSGTDETEKSDILDDRRDHDSQQEEDVKGHKIGDDRPEHTTRAKD